VETAVLDPLSESAESPNPILNFKKFGGYKPISAPD